MKAYSLSELRTEIRKQGYKYIAMFDSDNNTIVAFNNSKTEPAEQLKKIITRLGSTTLSNGMYYVHGKNGVQKHLKPDIYPVYKNDGLSEPGPVQTRTTQPIIEVKQATPEVLTWNSALELHQQIMLKDSEIHRLKSEIIRLEERIQDLEADAAERLEDDKPSMLDNAKSFLSETLVQVTPLLDKLLDQRDRKLAIQEKRLDLMRPKPAAAPKQVDIARAFIEAYIQTNGEDDSWSESLIQAYNSAQGMDMFINALQEITAEDEEGNITTAAAMFNQFVESNAK